MADTTAIYGWPYQELTDPPDGAAVGQDLAEAIEATVSGIEASVPVRVGRVLVTADGSAVTAETEIASLTVNLVNGVAYELRWSCHVSVGTAATNVLTRVRDTTVAGTEIAVAQHNGPSTSSVGYVVSGVGDFTAVATGSKVFKLTVQTNTGAQTVQLRASATRKCRLEVWQIP